MKSLSSHESCQMCSQSPHYLPLEGLIRLEQVLHFYPVGKTTLYKEIKEGKFPAPKKRGRSSFWDAVEVRRFLKEAGATMTVPEK